MSSTSLLTLVARCRALCRPRSHAADVELLTRFAQQRDAAAFEELLERYAPMVWGVCRRIAPTEADGEDAFQATFLALTRQAGRLHGRQPLGGWLHTVAVRVARKAAARARKQTTRATLPEPATPGDIADEVGSRELFRMVDEEIERLPSTVRIPLILCCLQGRTRDEAATLLGCSVAAVKSRLERGRDLLRRRLQQRGVQLPAAFLVLGLTSERIRAALWAKTMQSALHPPAPAIIALAEAGLSAATVGKGKLFLIALLLVSCAAGAAGTLLTQKLAEAPAFPQAKPVAAEPKKPQTLQVRTDRHGDPLPNGAIARLGTVRWRHGFLIQGLVYSPDGKMIAAVGAGRAITLWDAATGKEIHQFPNGEQPSYVAFSPDGKILATGGFWSFTHLWDVATGKELRQIEAANFAFSPDGKLVSTRRYDGKAQNWDGETVRTWDANTGKELHCLYCKQGELRALAYSPDGKLLAVAGADGAISLWVPTTETRQKQLTGHEKAVSNIVFSPDGKRLASSSNDGTIRLWDVTTGRQSRILTEKLGEFDSKPITFSPDGTLLAAGFGDGTIRLWDVKGQTEKRSWQAGAINVSALAFSPDGKTLVSGGAWDAIRLWDVAAGCERQPSEEHLGFVDLVRFSLDGASLISISQDKRMLWWNLAAQKPRRRFSWTDRGYKQIALSPDGHTLAVCLLPAKELRLWDTRTGKSIRRLGKHQKDIAAIAFSPDGRLVASAEVDEGIHIWDVRDGKEIRKVKGLTNKVMTLCFSPDSKALACGIWTRGERSLRIWEVNSGKETVKFLCLDRFVGPLVFSPDGKVLASGGNNSNYTGASFVRLWDTATGKERCVHEGHEDPVGAIAFSPNGKLVASGASGAGYRDNSVQVWEMATGRLIRRFEGHHSCISSVAFSPDGLTLASGAGDSTILLWDITGRRADGRWSIKPLTPSQLDACWTALTNEDAAQAYDAVWALTAAPEQAVPFLQKHLPPVSRPDVLTVARMIADLDNDNFMVRHKATVELSKLGDAVRPALLRELDGNPSLEVRRRIQQLLDQACDWTPERLREHRAIQALEHIGTKPVREMLQALAEGVPGAYRTEEAKAALHHLSRDR